MTDILADPELVAVVEGLYPGHSSDCVHDGQCGVGGSLRYALLTAAIVAVRQINTTPRFGLYCGVFECVHEGCVGARIASGTVMNTLAALEAQRAALGEEK